MKEYEVVITETLKKTVRVMADSFEEAQQTVTDDWYKGEYILDADDFTGVDFEAKETQPEKIKVVLLEPGKLAQVTEVGYQYEEMKKVVGENIDIISLDDDSVMVFNRDGKMDGLPLNRSIKNDAGRVTDIIAGKCFICKGDGDDLTSLSDEQVKKFTEQFKRPEKFFRVNGEIVGVPFMPKSKEHER